MIVLAACAAHIVLLSACASRLASSQVKVDISVNPAPTTVASSLSAFPSVTGPKRDEAVDVEWHGAWYPANVVDRQAAGWLIHYDGYGAEWDEVVDATRIRRRSS